MPLIRTGSWIAVPLIVAGTLASSARAVDGAIEINQACAAGPGCFPGDAAGFPVTIGGRGSYRLTSNLTAPDQDTTVIAIAVGGVTLDLNGFTIAGTGDYGLPPSTTCSGTGNGSGVSASSDSVVVSNGLIVGMGRHGVSLTSNSRVERVFVNNCCGSGILVGSGSLVRESVVSENLGNGIVTGAATRVSACIAAGNGVSGIASVSNTRVSVEGCIATGNGVDGIAGGPQSAVSDSITTGNLDDGIALFGSAQVVESVAFSNGDRGITVLGSPATFDSTAVGLNVSNTNTGLELSGGVVIGCNVLEGVTTCPP